MCGIFALINSSQNPATQPLQKGTEIISHRGPDDEGYMLWNRDTGIKVYSGKDTSSASQETYALPPLPEKFDWKVGFGHRRLSIIDLSSGGHQPMIDNESGLSLTYNGEIYNYKELRNELISLGHSFKTDSDSEVLLIAWQEWGAKSLDRFNGMFAFVILDSKRNKLYVVRDRFGVKPLYYHFGTGFMAFASEVKQLRLLPDYNFQLNESNAYDYLRYGSVDHNSKTFEIGIEQVGQGCLIEIDLETNRIETKRWYELKPKTWIGTFDEACEEFYSLLKDSVNLRMRSDVPVGSALSGGLDSSTIVSLMREVLEDQGNGLHPIKTVTSCNADPKYDEWDFAEKVIQKVGAKPYKVFPSFDKLTNDLDRFMWHMDYPFGSTSQFSQWCVFEGAAKAELKVMIDGQGADEQLAGYGGNDMSLYTGLLGKLKVGELFNETRAYRKYHKHWPTGFLIGALQNHVPRGLLNLVPDRYRVLKQHPPEWLRPGSNGYSKNWPSSLMHSLYNQVTQSPLPSLLRYEDRNSMAFSIESRVPFMDYRLIEFTLGLPEEMVYRKGERKYILRQAFEGKVPSKILARKDKMGFVSAEEHWLKHEGKEWFWEETDKAGHLLEDFVDHDKVMLMLEKMQKGETPFDFTPWRIICLGKWLEMMKQ